MNLILFYQSLLFFFVFRYIIFFLQQSQFACPVFIVQTVSHVIISALMFKSFFILMGTTVDIIQVVKGGLRQRGVPVFFCEDQGSKLFLFRFRIMTYLKKCFTQLPVA